MPTPAVWLLALAVAADPAPGFIHIRTGAGVAIKLDGKPRGVTDYEGLVLRDVTPGRHRLQATLEGHREQHALISVEPGELVTHRLRPWQPNAPPAQNKSGTLFVEALASRATIDAFKLGWKKIAFDGEPFVAAQVPEGRHKLTFCNPDKCIDYRAQVRAGEVMALRVDFGLPAIHDVTALKKAQLARWKEACGGGLDEEACLRACNSDLTLTPEVRSASCEAIGAVEPAAAALMNVSAALSPPCEITADAAHGWVTIRTNPAAEVFLGEKRIGTTPLPRVELPAGCVELRAVAEEQNLDKVLRVEVEPGQVTVYAIDL